MQSIIRRAESGFPAAIDERPGDLRVFVIGCGNAFGSRLTTTSLLFVNGDCVCLVDCPYKLHNVLAEFSHESGFVVSPKDITHVIVTHNHWDHVAGLEMFLRMRMLECDGRKPVIVTTAGIYDDLWNHTLSGSLKYFMDSSGEGSLLSDKDYIDWLEVRPGEERLLGDMILQIRANVTHPGPTIGIRLRNEKCDVGYSGDGIYDPELTERLYLDGVLSGKEKDDLLGFLWDSRLIFHNVGPLSEGVHTRLSRLLALPGDVRERIRLVNLADDFQSDELRPAEQNHEYTSEACLP